MKSKCAKCKEDAEGGACIVEGGVGYMFCKACSDLLESSPTGTIKDFLHTHVKENWVKKNMRQARERRERGESLWSKKSQLSTK